MDESSLKRLRAAMGAAWTTVVVGLVWVLLGWLFFLHIMRNRPQWIINAWGGGPLTWAEVQTMTLWFFGAMKMILFVALLAALWLTLWIRRLRQA